jgi:alkanesulfonate monooxygenase SsuD/methylene tetrahydromethanopterin reductase-like flavin-dependent oxidoreductase (luciferase family)
MKLGLGIGYSGGQMRLPVEKVQLAERLGFDSVWTAEAYGSDAITPLAYLAAKTERIRLGTGIMQLAGRTATMAAMQAGTVDALAGGNRVIAGIGVSGPQIVEGWYGEPWGRPYYRIKDYVTIMRKVFRREEPVTHDGREISLPAGEVADGLLPLGFGPGSMEMFRPWLEEGFKRAGGGKSLKDFEIQAGTSVVITNDVRGALQVMKPNTARYVGGMGHKNINFHNDMMVRRGFPEAAARIQELYLAGRVQEAIDAVPDEYLDLGALIGPVERIKDRYREWEESGATGLTINADPQGMELMADLAGTR